MQLPTINRRSQTREQVENFRGYNHRDKIRNDEFWDMTNIGGKYYPLLANRDRRGTVRVMTNPGGLIEKDALCYVEDGTLYVNDAATPITGLSSGEKQLVGMGAYIVIFPDKKYYNTEDSSDYGNLEATYTSSGTVDFYPCDVDGNIYNISTVSGDEPTDPVNGEIWVDTSGSTKVMMQWSTTQSMWVSIPTVYTKITFRSMGTIPQLFKQFDGVKITGTARPDDLDGEKILYAVGGDATTGDYIVVVGLLDAALTAQECSVVISRSVPQMDYVCECQNRLWGCYYGLSDGKVINEIYCCALGDFKNWRQYMGLSTDSWTASVGSDGQWTGAVNYLGHPCFFKENRIHTVTVSSAGAHQIEETICRGVQKGSWKSLVVVDEVLYYKSRTDVCAWQGGFPKDVSYGLGENEKFSDAAAGCYRGNYYISMKDQDNHWHLFVLNTKYMIWYREDDLHVQCFCRVDDELYCIEAGTGKLLALNGTTGTLEENVTWMAESGILYYETPDRKYISRFNVKVWLAEGAQMNIYAQYDSDGTWVNVGKVTRRGMGTTLVPVKPRRCDHMKLRFTGTGDTKIYSVARIIETGSDYR